MDYKNAGVDIEAGYESVELMKKYVKATMRPEVLGGLGGFSGAFSLQYAYINQQKHNAIKIEPRYSIFVAAIATSLLFAVSSRR